MTPWRLATLVVTFTLACASALAQPPMSPGRAEVSIEWSHDGYAPGDRGAVAVVLDIEPRWHIYAGKGTPHEPESYIPTTIDITWPPGWAAGAMQWPEVHEVLFGPPGAQELLKVYEGRTIVIVPFTVDGSAAPGSAAVSFTAGYQACDDQVCEMPRDVILDETVKIVQDGTSVTANSDASLAAMFEKALAAGVSTAPQITPPEASADATPAETASARRKFFGIPMPEQGGGAMSLIFLALLSALGGFILNLTPCVLPVIPIKILTIMQHANHPGRTMALGMWMALGVVAFWIALGLPVALFTGVTDPSRLFGIWWVTLGIGVLIAMMGVGIMGLFTIQLPQAAYAVNPRADTWWGSFVFGVMTGVLGLPCFGFVAGALLAGVATMPPSWIMTIFTSLGVGMAAPYLVLSAKPSLVERIPRTGPASELVKQVMGLLLLAAAAYFIGSGLLALIAEFPYVARQLHWWTVALFGALAGLWLIIRTFQITPATETRLFFLVIGLLVGGVGPLFALSRTNKARGEWEIRQAAIAESGGASYIHGLWNDWTPAAFEQARVDGHIVVLDFTATWCVNCQIIKSVVLDREPVRSALNADDIVKFTVDNTSTTAPGWEFMAELGQSGIPLLAIYTPGKDEPWLSNAYTSQQVVAALNAARDNRLAGP